MSAKIIKLEDNEITALIHLLDIAVKAKGLEVAQPASFFQSKLKNAISEKVENPNKEDAGE